MCIASNLAGRVEAPAAWLFVEDPDKEKKEEPMGARLSVKTLSVAGRAEGISERLPSQNLDQVKGELQKREKFPGSGFFTTDGAEDFSLIGGLISDRGID